MMQALPLLHAAQRMTDAAALDIRVLAALLVAVAAALTFVALALGRNLRRRAFRRRLITLFAATVTLLAVLPSVFPYDHLLPATAHGEDHAAVHASHCHDTPASCADAPVSAGPGQLFDADPLIIAPAMLSLAVLATVLPALRGRSVAPALRPPLRVTC